MHLGIDIGGTKTEVCLLLSKDASSLVFRERMPTLRDAGISTYFTNLRSLIQLALKKSSKQFVNVQTIGVGLPGAIHPVHQIMSQGSVAFFKDIDLKSVFSKEVNVDGQTFKGQIRFDNDANCFALAELHQGAGFDWAKGNQVQNGELSMIGITLGTGVGGGLISNGQMIRGCSGGAGELGHLILIEGGRPCYCGRLGCVEQYISGPAFEYFYQLNDLELNFSEKDRPHSNAISAAQIFELAKNNHPVAIKTINDYCDHIVRFISNLSNLLDPHVVVLGGGMSAQDLIYNGINQRLDPRLFFTNRAPVVVRNKLGGSAGVIGAALLPVLE